MDLTDKAREDFLNWYEVSDYGSSIDRINITFKNALIIEWFDSIGIYIITNYSCGDFDYEVKDYTSQNSCKIHFNSNFESRQEATKQAIIKANKIYNERNF